MERMTRGASLRERCLVAIRAGIITGEIRPGAMYSAPALAQQLGVSATPVREAMLDLANEGMVEPVRNRGFRVVDLSDKDLDEIHAIRLLLEVPSVVALTGDRRLLTDGVVTELRTMCSELEQHAEEEDVAALIDADTEFHNALLGLSGNERLVELVSRLRNQTLRYGMRHASHSVLIATATDHRKIVDAIVSTDKAEVQRVMEAHLAANRGVLAAAVDDEEPPVDSAGTAALGRALA
jgi:DNA-binding GntR family transcriptional regulator